MEKPANNVEGFLIFDHVNKQYVFRTYDEGDNRFKDYCIVAEDVPVRIIDGKDYYRLLEYKNGDCRLDYKYSN